MDAWFYITALYWVFPAGMNVFYAWKGTSLPRRQFFWIFNSCTTLAVGLTDLAGSFPHAVQIASGPAVNLIAGIIWWWWNRRKRDPVAKIAGAKARALRDALVHRMRGRLVPAPHRV